MTISGTGLSEWAVCGWPSGVSISSLLPWSAVTMQTPPLSWTALDDSAEALVDDLDGAHARPAITPVWPTMSALAKLMIAKRGRSSAHAATKASAAARALISGAWS